MKLFLERKPAMITWLMKYRIDINGKEVVLKKSGFYPIEVEDTDVLNILVCMRNYYSGETEISNIKANDKIEIRPSYNQKLYLFSLVLALGGFFYGLITEKKIPGTIALLVFLGVQIYYFHIRSTEFFNISIQK
ncbi:MAG: hypothetical protein WC780_02640 [Lentimicrobiaceae bacterium]|jgi:hypothetical protein